MVEKFAYQFEFKFGDDDRIIIVGTTSSSLVAKLSEIQQKIHSTFGEKFVLDSSNFSNLKNLVKNEPKT